MLPVLSLSPFARPPARALSQYLSHSANTHKQQQHVTTPCHPHSTKPQRADAKERTTSIASPLPAGSLSNTPARDSPRSLRSRP
jgi:hypothetical protein